MPYERLTYLLGICISIIAWGITQLNTSLADDKVMAYSISTRRKDADTSRTILNLENLSRKSKVISINVTFPARADKACRLTFKEGPLDIELPLEAPPPSDKTPGAAE